MYVQHIVLGIIVDSCYTMYVHVILVKSEHKLIVTVQAIDVHLCFSYTGSEVGYGEKLGYGDPFRWSLELKHHKTLDRVTPTCIRSVVDVVNIVYSVVHTSSIVP